MHILRNEPFKNAVNMPPVPADVLNKLQPYFSLGEKIGSVLGQIAQGAVSEIVVNYAGDLMDVDTSPLTRYIVKGIFQNQLESINIINACIWLNHAVLTSSFKHPMHQIASQTLSRLRLKRSKRKKHLLEHYLLVSVSDRSYRSIPS